MKIRTLFPLLALLVPVLKAETLVVLSGNSIQEKIDAASDGDIIAIFGGGMGLISFAVSCFTGVLILFVLSLILGKLFPR